MTTRNVAVIVAHPDDEVLGCGGTIAKLAESGARVCVVFACGVDVNAAGRASPWSQACSASEVMGVFTRTRWNLDDQRLDLVGQRELSRLVTGFLAVDDYDTVYTHHPGDLNADHRAVAEAVLVATRPTPVQTVRAVYACEVPSSTEWSFGSARPFRAQRLEVLGEEHVAAKVEALACYEGEVRKPPHPRSEEVVRLLARCRGAKCGHEYAEAFEVLREVVR